MTPVNIIVSTLAEIRLLKPLMKEYQEKGREVNVRLMPLHTSRSEHSSAPRYYTPFPSIVQL